MTLSLTELVLLIVMPRSAAPWARCSRAVRAAG
jgi:hypothetical protein